MVIHGALEARISVDGNVARAAGADIQRIFENVNHWSSCKERLSMSGLLVKMGAVVSVHQFA
jgi:hypothetical protein